MWGNKQDGTPVTAPSASGKSGRGMIGPTFSIRSLEVFAVVARTGSMSAAAEHLQLSQSAVSQAIRALETSLGVQLFDRSVRPPALTLQATGLLKHAIAIIENHQKFEEALRLGNLAQLPSLRLGMLNSVVTTMGVNILERLRDRAAEVSIDSGFHATRFEALANREFDFIVTADESLPSPDFQILPVLTEPLLIVAPQSYSGDIENIAEISSRLDLIRFGRDPNLLNRMDRAIRALGIVPQRRYHLDTNEAVIQMVSAGAGWTILPVLAVLKACMRSEAIRLAPYPSGSLDRTIVLAMRKGEGLHVAEQIQSAAIEVLNNTVIPNARLLVPQIADRIVVHEASQSPSGAHSNQGSTLDAV